MSDIYAVARQRAATGAMHWDTGAFSGLLVSGLYTANHLTDATMAAIPSAARVAPLIPLTGTSVVNGTCYADDMHLDRLLTSDVIAGLVVVENAGLDPEAYPLVLHFDQGFGARALGGAVVIEWATIGVFRL